jgi:hypothetical protein
MYFSPTFPTAREVIMPLIDQYLNYVESYTKLSNKPTFRLLSSLTFKPMKLLSKHLSGSLSGWVPTVCSSGVHPAPVGLILQIDGRKTETADRPYLPLVQNL